MAKSNAKQSAPLYDNMEFPPYEHREYPKWITLKDGSSVIADDKHHHLKLIAEDKTDAKPDPVKDENTRLSVRNAELEEQLAALKKPAPAPAKPAVAPAPAKATP